METTGKFFSNFLQFNSIRRTKLEKVEEKEKDIKGDDFSITEHCLYKFSSICEFHRFAI